MSMDSLLNIWALLANHIAQKHHFEHVTNRETAFAAYRTMHDPCTLGPPSLDVTVTIVDIVFARSLISFDHL